MLFCSSLLVILLAITIRADADSLKSCETHISSTGDCSAVISFSGDCKSSKVFVTETELTKCPSVNFFWSYPQNNMTLVIETQYTPVRKSYTIYLDNRQVSGAVQHIYRLFNNQETEVTTRDQTLIQFSDSNYQVILKFQAPKTMGLYGTNINYRTVPLF